MLLFYVFESSNWEHYEIIFLKVLANQKLHAGKDRPLHLVCSTFVPHRRFESNPHPCYHKQRMSEMCYRCTVFRLLTVSKSRLMIETRDLKTSFPLTPMLTLITKYIGNFNTPDLIVLAILPLILLGHITCFQQGFPYECWLFRSEKAVSF